MHPQPQDQPASASYAPMQSAQTRYAFVVKANNPVPGGVRRDAEMSSTIRLSGARSEDVPLATVFEPRATERWNRQSPVPFWIHGGRDGGLMCSVQPTGPDAYDVYAADGAPLARITRRAGRFLPWPRRIRWTAQLSGAPQPFTGKVGSWYSWLAYALSAPVWLLFFLCVLVYSLIEGDTSDSNLSGPTRTRWRTAGSGAALDYRGINKVYHLDPQRLDVRVAYAQAVLQSWERVR
jgi:hypothetical protein